MQLDLFWQYKKLLLPPFQKSVELDVRENFECRQNIEPAELNDRMSRIEEEQIQLHLTQSESIPRVGDLRASTYSLLRLPTSDRSTVTALDSILAVPETTYERQTRDTPKTHHKKSNMPRQQRVPKEQKASGATLYITHSDSEQSIDEVIHDSLSF